MKIINLVIAMCLLTSTCCAEVYNEKNNNVSSVEIKFLDLEWNEPSIVSITKMGAHGFVLGADGTMTKTVNGLETAVLTEFIEDRLVRVVVNIETNDFETIFKTTEADFKTRYGVPALMVRDAAIEYQNDYFNKDGLMKDEIILGNSHVDKDGNILAYGSYASIETGVSLIMSFESNEYLLMDENLDFAMRQDELVDDFVQN